MRWLGPAAALLGIGWYFALCVLVGLVGGRWLDQTFATSPLFTLIGVGIGLMAALIGGYRMLVKALKLEETKENSKPQ